MLIRRKNASLGFESLHEPEWVSGAWPATSSVSGRILPAEYWHPATDGAASGFWISPHPRHRLLRFLQPEGHLHLAVHVHREMEMTSDL